MLTILLVVIALLIGLAIGAYSHKWLAKVTGAPANLTPANAAATAESAAAALLTHGKAAALSAIDSAAEAAKQPVLKA